MTKKLTRRINRANAARDHHEFRKFLRKTAAEDRARSLTITDVEHCEGSVSVASADRT